MNRVIIRIGIISMFIAIMCFVIEVLVLIHKSAHQIINLINRIKTEKINR